MTDSTNPQDPTHPVSPGTAPLDISPAPGVPVTVINNAKDAGGPEAAPEVPDIPINTFGHPAWVVWDGKQIIDRGISRYVGYERMPTIGEAEMLRGALHNMFAEGVQISEARPDRVETRQGVETLMRVRMRPGAREDVVGIIYYQASIQGVPLPAESHRLSVLMVDGRKYLSDGDGNVDRCVFCNQGFSPISSDARGKFHEKCFKAEMAAHRREKESERDVIFARGNIRRRA